MVPDQDGFVWRKSSYSGGQNGDCVELGWRKSSYSGGQNGNCVEVASALTAVRDSKNSGGPVLRVDLDRFVAEVKAGRFAG
jgi:hypothetical protein